MTKFVALVSLIVISAFNSLGNFYFTYGIWPKSWGAFVLFTFTGMLIFAVISAVAKSDE